jgi:CBS domain-containing protein
MDTHNAARLAGDIYAAPDVATLVRLSRHLPQVLVQMIQNGVPARDVAYTLSLRGQDITRRLLVLAEVQFGKPPIPYAFAAGSARAGAG